MMPFITLRNAPVLPSLRYFSCLIILGVVAQAQGQTWKGWPRSGFRDQDKVQASPLVADLDGNGLQSVLVPAFDGKLYVYNHDGTQRQGSWPATLSFPDGTVASVAVGDVHGSALNNYNSSAPEIVVFGDDVNSENARLLIYDLSGTQLTTITVTSTSAQPKTLGSAKGTPCLVDCYRFTNGSTRHNPLEIVVRDGDGVMLVYRWNGAVTGTSRFTEQALPSAATCSTDQQRDRSGSQPITPSVSATVSGTNQTDLIAPSTDGKVYRWRVTSTGTSSANNWSAPSRSTYQTTGTGVQFYGSAAVGNIDNVSGEEIIVGGTDGLLHVWKGDGTGAVLPGWPRATGQSIVSSPALVNLDEDVEPEIVVGSDDGKVYAFNADGSQVPGWPQSTRGDVFGSPVAGELDGQPGLEVVAASLDGHLYAWTRSGVLLSGWPKRLNTGAYASPALGDLHGSGRLSVVSAGFNGEIFMFDLANWTVDKNAGWSQFRGGPTRTGTK